MITNEYIYNIPWLPNDYYNTPSNLNHQIWGPKSVKPEMIQQWEQQRNKTVVWEYRVGPQDSVQLVNISGWINYGLW